MCHLLEIISSSFGRYVQRKLADLDVWYGQFTQVRSCLQDGLNICEKWSSAADLLTSQFWQQYALHPWKGGPFVSGTLLQLTLRLEEVMALRVLHEQLLHLLSPSEQQEFNLANMPLLHLLVSVSMFNITTNVYINVMGVGQFKKEIKEMYPLASKKICSYIIYG